MEIKLGTCTFTGDCRLLLAATVTWPNVSYALSTSKDCRTHVNLRLQCSASSDVGSVAGDEGIGSPVELAQHCVGGGVQVLVHHGELVRVDLVGREDTEGCHGCGDTAGDQQSEHPPEEDLREANFERLGTDKGD